MKKILTTTVMTAILATSGFSADPVDVVVYGKEDFQSGTDNEPTTIKPSGTVDIGCSGSTPVIASDWTLEKGSVMNVKGDGFKLTGEIKINPNDGGKIPVQCNLKNDGKLYFEYADTSSNLYYKLIDESGNATGNYLCSSDLTTDATTQPTATDLTQTMTSGITGSPIVAPGATRESALIDMSLKSEPKTTTLNKIQVVTPETTSLSSTTEYNYGNKVFYVYDACFANTKTEVYSPERYDGEKINYLWSNYGSSPNPQTGDIVYTGMFDVDNLGESDVYVKGVPSGSGLDANYYTQLSRYDYELYELQNAYVCNVSLQTTSGLQGCICGGAVTYIPEGESILLEDTATTFADDSSLKEKDKCKLVTDGFEQEYLKNFPILKRGSDKLDLATKSSYSGNVTDDSTLKTYLESFGYHPDSVAFSSGSSGLDLIKGKDDGDAIQIPQNYKFEKAANTASHTISTNLHNVGVAAFDQPLKFTGTGATATTLDTLVFSGDNRELNPEKGVEFTDVNVTFNNANSLIANQKDNAVTIKNTVADGASTVTLGESMPIYSDITAEGGVCFKGGSGTTMTIFGTFTLK